MDPTLPLRRWKVGITQLFCEYYMQKKFNKYTRRYYLIIIIAICYFSIPPPSIFSDERPSYQLFRFNEDWSTIKDCPDKEIVDRIKYMPLSKDESAWLSLGGRMRGRAEVWSDFAFGTPVKNDDTFLLYRFLLHGDLHLGKHVRFFVESINASITDRDLPGGRRISDVDTADLVNAFVDLTVLLDELKLTLRIGRQQFAFGKARLVSPLPWGNSYRRWDGFSLIASLRNWKMHAFATKFVPVKKYDFNKREDDHDFYGAYFTYKNNLDIYYLGRQQDPKGSKDTERHTFGVRYGDKIGNTGFDYDFEAAYQIGKVDSNNVSAFMLGSQFGYTFTDTKWKPRVWLGLDFGSGDNDPTDKTVKTFDQLFPLGHASLGFADVVGRQNIIDFRQGILVKPMKKLKVRLDHHIFWRAAEDDALYGTSGNIVRSGNLSNKKFVGIDVDMTLNYQFNSHLSSLLGYSHFFAEDFIEDTGKHEDIDFFYLQMQITF